MGKTTLYHPVSLHVIRGAVEYCGWKFKTIKQVDSNLEKGRASYIAEIEIMPNEVWLSSALEMEKQLQKCFMDDIRVYWLRKTRSGKYFCDLVVTVPESATIEDALELEAADNE